MRLKTADHAFTQRHFDGFLVGHAIFSKRLD
jgi:hypothetical protein